MNEPFTYQSLQNTLDLIKKNEVESNQSYADARRQWFEDFEKLSPEEQRFIQDGIWKTQYYYEQGMMRKQDE